METISITGANRGIGLELARGFAGSGRHVIACCRRPGEASELQTIASGLIPVIDALTLDDSPCFESWEGNDHVW